jgi:predicted phosphodiesterase
MVDLCPRYAVISDIHSNIEATVAVLDDIHARGIEDIICLGDVIGYGPSPIETLDVIMDSVRICLMGNHDEALLKGARSFNQWARDAIDWTRDKLQEGDPDIVKRRFNYIENMGLKFQTNGLYFVHGSPRHPTVEYILREDIYNGAYDKFEEIFASFEKCLFVGHSHTPCVISEDLEYQDIESLNYKFCYTDSAKKFIINVGSVGQPRDKDTRACYVEIDKNIIYFHRVEYDFKATKQRILGIERLSNKLGERLVRGV